MSELELQPNERTLRSNAESLVHNEYAGRVIVMGRSKAADAVIQAYALMGRSTGSKNRKFVEDSVGFRTIAPGMTEAEMSKVKNADLIYYRATASIGGIHVVSNGAQTPHVLRALAKGENLRQAVEHAPEIDGVDLSKYEPDEPNYTPRITGAIDLSQNASNEFGLAVVHKDKFSDAPFYRVHGTDKINDLAPGVGYVIHTYKGNAPEGEPLPSFDKEPYPIAFDGSAEIAAKALWELLNEQRRVAVLAQTIDTQTSQITDSFTLSIHD